MSLGGCTFGTGVMIACLIYMQCGDACIMLLVIILCITDVRSQQYDYRNQAGILSIPIAFLLPNLAQGGLWRQCIFK